MLAADQCKKIEADPWHHKFSVSKAYATFRRAGFTRIVDKYSRPGWPCVCVARKGVTVVGHRLGYEVYAPGDGGPMAAFPDAQLAIRFVRAFERKAELMAANGFSDEQFNRIQLLAGKVYEEFVQELEETLKRVREW